MLPVGLRLRFERPFSGNSVRHTEGPGCARFETYEPSTTGYSSTGAEMLARAKSATAAIRRAPVLHKSDSLFSISAI